MHAHAYATCVHVWMLHKHIDLYIYYISGVSTQIITMQAGLAKFAFRCFCKIRENNAHIEDIKYCIIFKDTPLRSLTILHHISIIISVVIPKLYKVRIVVYCVQRIYKTTKSSFKFKKKSISIIRRYFSFTCFIFHDYK